MARRGEISVVAPVLVNICAILAVLSSAEFCHPNICCCMIRLVKKISLVSLSWIIAPHTPKRNVAWNLQASTVVGNLIAAPKLPGWCFDLGLRFIALL
jgi:hypothetical protein